MASYGILLLLTKPVAAATLEAMWVKGAVSQEKYSVVSYVALGLNTKQGFVN